MCCSIGNCGAGADQRLVPFAADLDLLKSHDISVTRLNLLREPAKSAACDAAISMQKATGVEGLPVVPTDDEMSSTGR